ncbi:GNAT family N-acetyltransferase [Chitinimonas arctica]|nr:GNAT family N-acetyltransferase [Chitinimonas arctica]
MTPTPPHLSDGSLIVRLAGSQDVTAFLTYLQVNRNAFAPVEPRRPESYYSAEACLTRIVLNRAQFQDGRSACLLVLEPDDRTVIGTINFSALSDYPHHAAVLGYSLAVTEWGKGRMYRALSLAIEWIFAEFNLHRLSANHLPDNERSGRLLAKLGFRREGYAPAYLLIAGVWRDHVLTALTNANWRVRGHTQSLVVGESGRASSI